MATMLGFIVLVAMSAHLAPQLSARGIFFGVTVAPAFHESRVARAVSRRYGIEVWLFAGVAAALVATSSMPLGSASVLLAQAVGAAVAFATARRAVQPYAVQPATIREAEIGPRPGLPGGLAGQLGPFLILWAAAAYVGLHWDDVPARFPTHWNLAGKPDGFTTKSVAGVFRGLSVGVILCATMVFTSFAVLHWTRLPSVTGQLGEQHRRVRRINLLATLAGEYLLALLLSWSAVVTMFSSEAARQRLPLAFRLAPLALIIVGTLAVRVVRRLAVPDGAHGGDTTPDSCWFFGRLYFNRRDPALFVGRRLGLGYTLNLGNPWSWLVMIVAGGALSIPLLLVP